MAQRHLRKTADTGGRSNRPPRVRANPQPAATDDVSVASEQLLALFAANDLEALIEIGFSLLRAAVPCDFVSALYRNAGDGLLKERDSRGRGYGVEFMHRYAELTPAIPLVMSSPGIKVLTTCTGLPASTKELQSTAFYREIMRPQGWRHGVSLCFWGDRPTELPILVTVAYRREGRRDFSEHDVVALARIHPFLDCAVNRLCEREAAKTLHDGTAMMVRSGAVGFALLDQDLLLVQANLAARRLCAAWIDDGAAHTEDSSLTWRMPPALVTACRELHDEWHTLMRADPDATGLRCHRRVVHPRVPELTASITMICRNTAGLADPTFVLEFDRRVHGVALETPDGFVPVLQKLTAAERAVALVVADGFSNQEIADRMGKSVHAVKFLLHRIYQKTGVPSRAALVVVVRSQPKQPQKP